MKKFTEGMFERGIRINSGDNGSMRFVTHYWISRKDIGQIIDSMKAILKEMNVI